MFLSLKTLTCMLNHPGINQQAPSTESKSNQYLDRQTERFKPTLCIAFFCIQHLVFFSQVSGLKETNDLFPCPAADLLKLWPLLCPPFIVSASISLFPCQSSPLQELWPLFRPTSDLSMSAASSHLSITGRI